MDELFRLCVMFVNSELESKRASLDTSNATGAGVTVTDTTALCVVGSVIVIVIGRHFIQMRDTIVLVFIASVDFTPRSWH